METGLFYEPSKLNLLSPVGGLQRVLIVEDDPFMQQFVKQSLKGSGLEVIQQYVATAEEAMFLLDKNSNLYDLVIADQYLLGSATGIELWQHCRQKSFEIPFILISGAKLEDFSLSLERIADGPVFLHKPFRPNELSSAIERAHFSEESHFEKDLQWGETEVISIPIPEFPLTVLKSVLKAATTCTIVVATLSLIAPYIFIDSGTILHSMRFPMDSTRLKSQSYENYQLLDGVPASVDSKKFKRNPLNPIKQ